MKKRTFRFSCFSQKASLAIVLSLWTVMLFGQRNCVVSGKIIDKASGDALIGAVVQLDSTDIGTVTDIDGNYRLVADAGKYNLIVRYFGYETAVIGIDLKPGNAANVEYAMSEAQALAFEEVVVTATAERSSDVVLNIELKKAPYITSGITASEIRRTPDRTVGDILKRVTGASIQEGKFVVIRGMNDRYNAGYLDGALLSSTESDRKAFAFDVIPASLIDNLIIIKSGTPDLTGDFGGGIIGINTKAVPDLMTQTLSVGVQFHSETTGKPFTQFKTYGGENFNFFGDQRAIPDFEDGALRFKSNFPTKEEKERVASISKEFNNDWSYTTKDAIPNLRASYSIGFPLQVGDHGKMGFIMALNYADTRKSSTSQINTFDGAGQVSDFRDDIFLHNINTGGIFNVNYVTSKTQLSLHNLLNITSDFNTVLRSGIGNIGDALTVQNSAFILNTNRLYNGILSFRQLIQDSLLTVDASLSYSNISRDIPDYRIASYTKTPDFPDYQLAIGDFFNSSTGRFGSEVDENLIAGKLELSKKFKGESLQTEISVGYFQQHRDREFSGRSFVYKGAASELTTDPSIDLGQDNIDASKLYLVEKTADDLSYYKAKSETYAVYAMANQKFGSRMKAIYGLRVENFDLDIHNHKTNQEISTIKETSILPSAVLTYYLNDKTNIRAGYFSSVNRPEFRELAPFSFFVFDKNAEIRGEDDLKIADLNNVDVRYEFYPSGGQLISIGGFYKYIKDPIELSLDITQPFTTFTYQNEKSATIYGLELELKKTLDFIGGRFFRDMGFYGNFSLIQSKLHFREGSQAKEDRPLQGQSPYIINLRLQYENRDNGWTASISYNQIGRRIAFVGVDPKFGDTRQDIYEEPRGILDAQLGKRFGHLNIKVTLGDLLHKDIIYYQDANQDKKYSTPDAGATKNDRLMYKFTTGFTTNIGLSYSF